MEKNDVFSAVRYLDIKNLSIDEMKHLMDLFKIKTNQMEVEIQQRKISGKN